MKEFTKKELEGIIESHRKWLIDNTKGVRANLRSADLRSANLRYANLRYADLRFADLRSANLSSANLSYANLRYANLRSANLSYANLSYANLRSANLSYANLDFSCFPLWCGSFDMKVTNDLVRQLAYHICRLDCNTKEFEEIKSLLKKYANKSKIIKNHTLDKID